MNKDEILALKYKAAKWDMLRKTFKFEIFDCEGYPLNIGDKVKIANGQVGEIVYECGAFGVLVEDSIDYKGMQEVMDKDPICCGNEFCGVENDNFISFWELHCNSNSEDDICRFIEKIK